MGGGGGGRGGKSSLNFGQKLHSQAAQFCRAHFVFPPSHLHTFCETASPAHTHIHTHTNCNKIKKKKKKKKMLDNMSLHFLNSCAFCQYTDETWCTADKQDGMRKLEPWPVWRQQGSRPADRQPCTQCGQCPSLNPCERTGGWSAWRRTQHVAETCPHKKSRIITGVRTEMSVYTHIHKSPIIVRFSLFLFPPLY